MQLAEESHNRPIPPMVANYQDEAASNDSKLKATFDDALGPVTDDKVFYRKAVVLLISWHEDVDDLNTKNEVLALEEVFRNTFHYQTQRIELVQNPLQPPQAQVNHALSELVFQHGDPFTLLIVYYAGHGKPGKFGGLCLSGNESENPKPDSTLHEILWESAEHNIRTSVSDVLVVFDCCCAGQLERKTRGLRRRGFEFLAATSANSTTREPGQESFTAAFIWALKSLVTRSGDFSTKELLNEILCAPHFPKGQYPRLFERGEPCLHQIVLAPISDEAPDEAPFQRADAEILSPENEAGQGQGLGLRFFFKKPISEDLVKSLGLEMKRLKGLEDLGAMTILWEGFNSPGPILDKYSVERVYVDIWKKNTINKGKEVTLPELILPSATSDTSSVGESPPETPNPDLPVPDIEIGLDQGVLGDAEQANQSKAPTVSTPSVPRKRTKSSSTGTPESSIRESSPRSSKRTRR